MVQLNTFQIGNVLQGSIDLFASLGLKINNPSFTPLPIARVLPDAPKAVSDIFPKVEECYFVGTIDDKTLRGEDESLDFNEEQKRVGESYQGMFVFAVDIFSHEKITRSEIATLNRAFNRASKAAPVALIVRYGKDLLSFSICERTSYVRAGYSGEKPGRVSILRDIDTKHPDRGHLDILSSMYVDEICSFDALYQKWLEVFNNDTLTKRFYRELQNWYFAALKVVRFPNDITTTSDDTVYNSEATIRLITRLIFVWFLKQRKLIPAELFDPNFVGDRLLKEFNPMEPDGLFGETQRVSYYYRGILQNLFFATLNSPLTKEGKSELTERRFKTSRDQFDVNNLMRYRDLFKDPDLFLQLCNQDPFLNGGLFDCLDRKSEGIYYDGFSERKVSIEQLCVPDYLFFSENIHADLSAEYDDKKQKNVIVRGLIKIFNSYQFTVEENTPLDQEVALDPELLGKVFENLLASFNPETKQTARKQTGSFYTPRPIVQYMVDESIVAHLSRTVGPELECEYRKLLSYTDETLNLSPTQRHDIMLGLYNCKILDPACGSGAFPMGVLQQMVHILTKIDPDNTQWKEMLLNIAIDETSEAYRNSTDAERQAAILDIERSFNEKVNRPDYARKLYLIENCIYGVDIQPIAIQISKLRFFISLVIDQKCNDNPAENYGIRPLPNLEAKFVAANSLHPLSADVSLGDNVPSVRELKHRLKRLNHKIFGIKSHRWKKELQRRLAETRLELVAELNSVGMFSQSESTMLAQWDMFDQNHSADFFDPEWMFGVKGGFDIVLANPPYVEAKKLKHIIAPIKDLYTVYSGTADLSIYFVERGMKLLSSGGILSYITTNKFFNTGYGKKLRKFILSYDLRKILNFEQVEVFEDVLVSSVILEVAKQSSSNEKFVYEKFYKLNYAEFQQEFALRLNSLGDYAKCHLDESEWSFANLQGLALKAKIECSATLLANIPGVNIYRGVTTGYNPAFIIDNERRDYFFDQSETYYGVVKNLLQGRNIRKWFFNETDENLIFIPWHFPLHESNISGASKEAELALQAKYPGLYNWLLSHKRELCKRNIEETNIRYEWYALQRCAASYYTEFEVESKIIWGLTADKWAYTIDEEQHYLPSNGYILTSTETNIYYLLAVINSKLMEHYFHYIGVMTAGGAYTLKAATISSLPIIVAGNVEPLANLAKRILDLKKHDTETDVTELESEIDLIVYRLYGLSYDEVLIVDPEPPFSREEYENQE